MGKLEGAEEFAKMLAALGQDLGAFQVGTVNAMANACLAVAAKASPTKTGQLRRGWYIRSGSHRTGGGSSAEACNNVDYAELVNNGHRVVNSKRETVGWVLGRFMLEHGIEAAEKIREQRFQQVIQEAKRRHGL